MSLLMDTLNLRHLFKSPYNLNVSLCVCLSVRLSVRLSTSVSVCPSICLSVSPVGSSP